MTSIIKTIFLYVCLSFVFTSVSSTRECNSAEHVDIVFLLDGSGSVGLDGFSKALEFLNKLIDAFPIGPSNTQVALVVFNESVDSRFNWNHYTTLTALKNAISRTPYPGGYTNITTALDHARQMFQSAGTGRRQEAIGIAILMTDGKTDTFQSSKDAAQKLKDLGVIVYTAGVGSDINVEELRNVATNSAYYFTATDYNSLETITGPITLSACTDIDGCICYNGGTCTPGNIGNKCNCPAIYTGFYCEKPICDESPCSNGGFCSVSGDDWFCSCQPGYTGNLCDDNIDECASSPCVHGTCNDGVNKFQCYCKPGYTGTLCDKDIDECNSHPCKNSGTCTDYVNSYTCQCAPGYTGTDCALDIDECDSSPCQNGATCLDWVNAFYCDCPPRYYGIYCETGECQPSVADLVFVLDSSVSQTKEEFGKQLDFINKFIDHIVLGKNNLQVAVITFSFKAVIEISLGQYNDNVTLKEAVRSIKYRPGATFTDKGLEAAKTLFDSTSRNRPFGHIAKRYVFVLTDGMSTKREATAVAAKNLKATVNKVLAIGIGKEVSHMELLTIASTENAATGRPYVYSVQNFNALYTVVKELVQLTCDECSWKTSSDIVFLFDMSATMSADNFQTGLNAITHLTHRTTQMETENNTVRIALVTYGVGIQLQRALNDSDTKQMFLSSIQRLVLSESYCQSDTNACETTKLDDAMKFADNKVFDKTINRGDDSREIVILLSNGHEQITDETKTQLDLMKRKERSFYAISLGASANTENLQDIVGDPALVFSVYDEFSIKSLDALTTEFFFSSCDLTNDFLNGS